MKHKAVIMVTIEVHPVNEKEECTGKIVPSEKLSEYSLKRSQLKIIEGFDEHDCLLKVKEWLLGK